MAFDPSNPIVKLCLQAMDMEANKKPQEASKLFMQAWDEATADFEKFIAAYYVSRHQHSTAHKLNWLETTLLFALKINDDSVHSALPALYTNLATCYHNLGNYNCAKKYSELATSPAAAPSDKGPFYHGTKAALQVGDLLTAGGKSNYQTNLVMNHIYFTALVNGAGLAAALAKGNGPEHVYIVEPMGSFENDPNVTDKKFPGNPTRSYRTTASLKIIGEVNDWVKQSPEQIQQWRQKLANNKGQIIN
ncbi:MAG TPA: NAD(+)--rifampin ADP-ribosyltransferase [Bacteroidia bacterium]|nr:NAD(+)--rifampin ADP-ribosyltransferase [Bacteroidia bacterium]